MKQEFLIALGYLLALFFCLPIHSFSSVFTMVTDPNFILKKKYTHLLHLIPPSPNDENTLTQNQGSYFQLKLLVSGTSVDFFFPHYFPY